METLLLLFLLIALDKDPALKDALRNFLGFYRENRELISAVLKQNGSQATAAEKPAAPQQPPAAEKQESRTERTDSLRVLEEYLKRCEA